MTITLAISEAQAALLRQDATLRTGMAPGLSVAAEQSVKDHLVAHYTQKPNKLGGASTGYWRAVHDSAKAVTVINGEASYTTTVTLSGVGLRMKLEGGVIVPKGVNKETGKPLQYLTIPVIAEAHGKTASEFPFLKPRGGALAKPQEGSRFGTAYFILARKAVIKPDPNIFPPAATVLRDMADALILPA